MVEETDLLELYVVEIKDDTDDVIFSFTGKTLHDCVAMLERISPGKILCVGNPFKEMKGNIIIIPDEYPRRAVV